jgi:hypothetical protein
LLAVTLGGVALTACSPDLPPALPSTAAYARFASRIELVDLVITDRSRAEKVRQLYADIETAMLECKRTNAGELAKLGARGGPHDDRLTRATIAKVRDAELAAFRRYVGLQLELRKSMSAEEFAELDAIK